VFRASNSIPVRDGREPVFALFRRESALINLFRDFLSECHVVLHLAIHVRDTLVCVTDVSDVSVPKGNLLGGRKA
jgi:hypothetical protein